MTTYKLTLPNGQTIMKKSKRDSYKFAAIVDFGNGWKIKGLSSERKGAETIANKWTAWGLGTVKAKVINVETV